MKKRAGFELLRLSFANLLGSLLLSATPYFARTCRPRSFRTPARMTVFAGELSKLLQVVALAVSIIVLGVHDEDL
jgi:hypothetical protein